LSAVPKPFFESKTLWVNGLTLTAAIITALTNSELIANNPQLFAWLSAALAGVNLVLRFLTTTAVSLFAPRNFR
jgi:hypothetical protein